MQLFRGLKDMHVFPPPGGGYFTMGLDGDVRQFWVVFGLKILGLVVNIGPNLWDWVLAEILAAHTPV